MPKLALQTIYSTFRFRPASAEECERRLWSTTFYFPVQDEGPFETQQEALDAALTGWDEEEQSLPFIVRYGSRPGFLGGVESGWFVYYLDLVPVQDLAAVRTGRLEAFVKTLGDSPFSRRTDAVEAARWEWRKVEGRIGYAVAAEVLEKHEVVDRRLARSQRLAVR